MKDGKSNNYYTFDKVSDWFDTDNLKDFVQVIGNGDIVELRSTKCSHWGVATRIPQSPITSKSKSKPPKPVPDEILIYHLIHSSKQRGQVGQFTLEAFWEPHCRIRINNTNNGANLYGTSRLISKSNVLQNAFTAYESMNLKWHNCGDFIRWSSEKINDDHRSTNDHSTNASMENAVGCY